MTIQVKSGQTIFDIALIAYQDASRVYELIADNPQIDNISSDLTGMTLTYTPLVVIRKEAEKTPKSSLKNVTIKDGQTLFDLALQYYGGAEKVYELIVANGFGSIHSVPTGQNLIYTVNNTSVPSYFRSTGRDIGTRYPYQAEGVEETFYRITESGSRRVTESSSPRIIE